MATPLQNNRLLEIPLYHESFMAYISPQDQLSTMEEVPVEALLSERMWILEEGHCMRNQGINFCNLNSKAQRKYQAGSVATLIDMVDKNEGYTIISELHIGMLSNERKKNLREIVGQQPPTKEKNYPKCIPNIETSLVIREDYTRERMLNIIANTVKSIIPTEMLDSCLALL